MSTSTGVPDPEKPVSLTENAEEHNLPSSAEVKAKRQKQACSSNDPKLTELSTRIFDEYKMLQDKMDKIGGFRFTIKGWSITAIASASVASFASTSIAKPATTLIVSLVLGLMVLFFFVFEVEQIRLSRLYGRRAQLLEKILRDIDRGNIRSLPRVPNTAHEIAGASYARRLAKNGMSVFSKTNAAVREHWRLGEPADRWFYVALLFIGFAPLLKFTPLVWRMVSNLTIHISKAVGEVFF